MKRLSFLVAIALSGAFAAGADAHVFESTTTLGVAKTPSRAVERGARVVVHGRLRSSRGACRAGKLVRLFLQRPGADRLVASDRTDGDGEYGIVVRPAADMTVYARFGGSSDSAYGHSHVCAGDSSSRLRIDVRGR